MNLPTILILGASGSGKTTSLQNLPPLETTFIDTENKGLPFALHEDINYIAAESNLEVMTAMLKRKERKYRVIDSFTDLTQSINTECNRKYNGFDIWKNVGNKIALFLDGMKSKECVTIVTAIGDLVEDITDDGMPTKVIRAATHGKMWEGKIESKFLIVLQTIVKIDKKTGAKEYLFRTQSTLKSPAKCPAYLELDEYMPNDIVLVLNKLKEKKII